MDDSIIEQQPKQPYKNVTNSSPNKNKQGKLNKKSPNMTNQTRKGKMATPSPERGVSPNPLNSRRRTTSDFQVSMNQCISARELLEVTNIDSNRPKTRAIRGLVKTKQLLENPKNPNSDLRSYVIEEKYTQGLIQNKKLEGLIRFEDDNNRQNVLVEEIIENGKVVQTNPIKGYVRFDENASEVYEESINPKGKVDTRLITGQ